MKKYKTLFWIFFILLLLSLLYIWYWFKYVCVKANPVMNTFNGTFNDMMNQNTGIAYTSGRSSLTGIPSNSTTNISKKFGSPTNAQVLGNNIYRSNVNYVQPKVDYGTGIGGSGKTYNAPQK